MMIEPVQSLWGYQAGGYISSIAITSDSQRIVIGSDEKRVRCFDLNGNVRWQHDVAGIVFSLSLAEKRQRILGGCSAGIAYLWDYAGAVLHEYKTDGSNVWGTAMTPDARVFALGTLGAGNTLYFYEDEACLWTKKLAGSIRRISLTEDGGLLAAGAEDHAIYLFRRDGTQLWKQSTGDIVWSGAHIVAGQYIAAGSNDRCLYVLNVEGQLLWKRDTGSIVNVVAAPPDGRCIAAAGGSGMVSLFGPGGELFWSYKTGGDVYGLAVSADSRFIVVGSNDHYIYLLDAKGNCVWRRNVRGEVFSIAITPDCQLLAAGSKNHTLYLFKNNAASSSDVVSWAARGAIRRIRSAYISNPSVGVARWLEEFDSALLQKDFACCQALLAEIQQEGYDCSTREQTFIASREAALKLCQGILHHTHHAYAEARQDYETSLRLHRELGNHDGEGQALFALDELARQPAEPDQALLDQLMASPGVLGNSTLLLERCLETLPVSERVRIIQAAKQSGRGVALPKGLVSEEAVIQASAAAAMNWLRPRPDHTTLGETMLLSPNWLVRWQAMDMLQQQASEDAPAFEQEQEQIQAILLQRLEAGESDPLVLRTIAQLLAKTKGAIDTTLLLRLLVDPDPDVRYAAVKALEVRGDRRALFVLERVVDGQDFVGNRIGDAARSALQAIRRRLPACQVTGVTLCRDITAQEQPVQAMRFFLARQPPRYCVVTLQRPSSGVRVTCTLCRGNGRIFQHQQVFASAPHAEDEDDLIELVEPPAAAGPLSVGLHRLLDAERDTGLQTLTSLQQLLTSIAEPAADSDHAEIIRGIRTYVLTVLNEEYEATILRNLTGIDSLAGGETYFREYMSAVRGAFADEIFDDEGNRERLFAVMQVLARLALELIASYKEEVLIALQYMAGMGRAFVENNRANIELFAREIGEDFLVDLLTEHEEDFEAVGGALSDYVDEWEEFFEEEGQLPINAAHANVKRSLDALMSVLSPKVLALARGGDGWVESESEEGAPSGQVLFSFSALEETAWLAGEYLVEIALNDLVEIRRPFRISEQALLTQAVTCLACNSAGEPADETTTFTSGETIHCSVLLEGAPLNLEIRAHLREVQPPTETPPRTGRGGILANLLRSRADPLAADPNTKSARTTAEGQQGVAFSWGTAARHPGTYTIAITVADTRKDCPLQILPAQQTTVSIREALASWLEQGERNLAANHPGKALAAYEQAIRLDPASVAAWIGKGRSFNALSRSQEALVAFEQAIGLDARSALAYTEKGLSLEQDLGRYKEALVAYEQALHLDASLLRAYVSKGLTLVRLEEDCSAVMKEALTVFDRQSQPDARAYNYRGIALEYLARPQEALAAYKQASSLDPLSSAFYSNQSLVYQELGYYEEALAAVEQAIQLNPHSFAAYDCKGDVFLLHNRLEEALAAYEHAARLNPFRASLLTGQSNVLLLLGRFDEAQQVFAAAQALEGQKT